MANPSAMESNSNSAGVEELSRLLLQGWTMLADVCPRVGCNIPLMRSRQGRVYCCNCRADVVIRNANDTDANRNSNDQQQVRQQQAGSNSNANTSEQQHDRVINTEGEHIQMNGSYKKEEFEEEKDRGTNNNDNNELQLAMMTTNNNNNSNNNNDNAPIRSRIPISDSRAIMTPLLSSSVPNNGTSGAVTTSNNELIFSPTASPPGTSTTTAATTNPSNTAATTRPAANPATTRPNGATGRPRMRQTNLPLPAIEASNETDATANKQSHTHHLNMNIDVDNELRMAEISAAYNLQILRMNLPVATDVETRRNICAAMTEAAHTIEAARKALQARMRVV